MNNPNTNNENLETKDIMLEIDAQKPDGYDDVDSIPIEYIDMPPITPR